MKKHHIIISGTGRAGTTFLIQLLTALGLDTGFDDIASNVVEYCNAGMEWSIFDPDSPYIIKSPTLCFSLEKALMAGEIAIDHAIIPMRDLFSAAESRRDVARRTAHDMSQEVVFGGLYGTVVPGYQEAVLAFGFYNLFETLTKYEIPVTMMDFPRFVVDPDYLFGKIAFLLNNISYNEYHTAFRQVSRPELIHDFVAG